jgi:hypothetical protein
VRENVDAFRVTQRQSPDDATFGKLSQNVVLAGQTDQTLVIADCLH